MRAEINNDYLFLIYTAHPALSIWVLNQKLGCPGLPKAHQLLAYVKIKVEHNRKIL